MNTSLKTPNGNSFEMRYEFFPHQKETVKFMLKNKWAYIFNEAGTCKTECIISSMAYHLLNNDCKKILIISTLSTLNHVWYKSIIANGLQEVINPVIIGGSKLTKEKKEKILKDNKHTTYIINPDSAKRLMDLLSKIKFDYIVIDEATSYKDHTTERYRSFISMIKKFPPKYFYLATGTPVSNGPADAFGLLRLFNPKIYTSFTKWQPLVEKKIYEFKWEPLSNWKETLFEQLQPAICFRKLDVLKDLAQTEFIFEKYDLTQEQEKHYKTMKEDFIAEIENGMIIESANAAVKLSKILQIMGGSLLDNEGKTIRLNCDLKLKVLKSIIKDKIKNKTIIFCSNVEQLDIIEEFLSSEYRCAKYSGSTSQNKRDEIINKFQNTDELDILIAMPSCMAHGLTLTKSDGIIYYNPCYSNEVYEQANARISRPSQTEIPKIFMMWANTTDYCRYNVLMKRMTDQDEYKALLCE